MPRLDEQIAVAHRRIVDPEAVRRHPDQPALRWRRMTDRTKQLLDAALELSLEERAVLLAELAASLEATEGPFDPEWLAEMERRAHEAGRDGRGMTLDQLEARLAERFPRPS
jgi:hypothetical protein